MKEGLTIGLFAVKSIFAVKPLFNKSEVNAFDLYFVHVIPNEKIHTFKERFLKHQVVDIKSSSKSCMIITKTYISTFFKRQQLFNFLLNTACNVLVNIDQTNHTWTPEGEGKILNGFVHREASVGVLIVWLQVIHGYHWMDHSVQEMSMLCQWSEASTALAMLSGYCQLYAPLLSLS